MQNIRNDRKTKEEFGQYVDSVKYLALEGSTLTFFGIVRYNAVSGKFEMTKLSSVIAGGIDEAYWTLDEKLRKININATSCLLLGATFLFFCGVAVY